MKKLLLVFCFVALSSALFADDFGQIKLENKKFVYQGIAYDLLYMGGTDIKAVDAGVDISYEVRNGNGILVVKTKDFAMEINMSAVRIVTGNLKDKRLIIGL
jgi:hypothetical protein